MMGFRTEGRTTRQAVVAGVEVATFNAEGYQGRTTLLEGWDVCIASCKLGDPQTCRVDDVSSGATVVRGRGPSREAAEQVAIGSAAKRLPAARRL